MLGRLGIRQKLTLLLVFPLAAVLLVMTPFTAERIRDAQSAGRTAAAAQAARDVGALIQLLQQERLLALGYLAAPNLERSALVAQIQDSADSTARLHDSAVTRDAISGAEEELDSLVSLRDRIIERTVDARTTFASYRAANVALLDALGLANPAGVDARGLGQLSALDALMRSNEEASSAGAGLVAVAGGLPFDREQIDDALTAEDQHGERFVLLVSDDQARLVGSVESGEAAERFDGMVGAAASADAPQALVPVSEALTAAISYTGLRRLAQDRIAREIATDAENRAGAARTTTTGVLAGGVMVIGIVLGLGVTISRSISRPVRRLIRAAGAVAEQSRAELVRVADSDSPDPAPPRIAAVEVESADEIGELAGAMNRVQATAALLLERQVTTRRNVGTMFANIARRTQNLVGRQLALIDDLERNERNPELLQRLFRLDHVATRLRRSADSLLVVSGTIDQSMSGAPSPLSEVIESALNEIEGARSVEVGEVCTAAVSAGLFADLRLLLAELLENATNFSPPGTPVEVSATLGAECQIAIVDHGVGMSPQRMAEENRRLVERERLDVAPTTVLGLFVVGRLARRHGLSVELAYSAGRGVTATVRIPAQLLSTAPVVGRLGPAEKGRPRRHDRMLAIEAIASGSGEPFEWFTRPLIAIGASSTPALGTGEAAAGDGVPVRDGLSRFDAGTSPAAGHSPDVLPPRPMYAAAERPGTSPAVAARAAVPRPAPSQPPVETYTRSGLVRRTPGTHMVETVRGAVPPDESPTVKIVRDPEAERAALNDYLSGLARGDSDEGQPAQPSPPAVGERHA